MKQLLVLFFALLPILAMADDNGSCGENLTWTFVSSTGTLTIQGNGAMYDYLYNEYMEYYDFGKKWWYSFKNDITTVVIMNGVTSIGEYAFCGCSSLASITIPNSVTSIGDNAFYQCNGLNKVIVHDIAAWCNIEFSDSSNPLSKAHHLYSDEKTEIKDLIIPNSVTSIGDYAFYYCSGLTSVTIPNSVTSIGDYAFYYCSGLPSVTIPNSVTSIGDYAFYYCSGLPSVTIPNSVTSIGASAFRYCNGLISVNISSSVIGEAAFYNCSSLTSVTISNDVTNIGDWAFYGCTSLPTIIIPNSVTSIGNYAFERCLALASVTIPNSVTSIGNGAFKSCALTSVTIPNSVTSIGSSAFYWCKDLTSVTIPNSITSIGSSAFERCTGLTSVITAIETPFAFGSYAFRDIPDECVLTVPKGKKDAYLAVGWTESVFKGGIVEATEPDTDISTMDNIIYIEPMEELSGTQATISLKMKNSAEIRGFQFDLYLPEGVTVVKSSKGKIQGFLSEGRLPDEDEHTLTFSEQSDGAIRFLCSSQYEETFTGNDGEIATLKVNISENMEDGEYPIQLKSMKLTENNISNFYETTLIQSKLTISTYILGDINGDGVVDVSDYTGVANHIHGNTPDGFNAKAADVDENGAIDVSDYTGIANIIHTGSIYGNSSNARPMRLSPRRANTDLSTYDNVIYISPFTATAGAQTAISIKMKNSVDIRGFQFDLHLPEGMTVVKSAKGRIQGALSAGRLPEEDEHELTFSEQNDGSIRFLCSSQYDETFTGNDGEIATLQVSVASNMADGDYPIQLTDMKLTETDISKFYTAELIETTVTIGETDTRVILDETSTTAPEAASNVDVCVKRTINANEWSTICLPFAMTEAQVETVFGDDVELADFIDYDYDDGAETITVNFADATEIEANHPYIIKVSSKVEEFTVDDVDITPEANPCVEYDNGKTGNKRKVFGTFAGTYVADFDFYNDASNYPLFLSVNKFYYATENTKHMKAFRGYFDFEDCLPEADSSASRIIMSFDNETTGIDDARCKKEEVRGEVYDLQGRKVVKPVKGLYIINGRKEVIK